MIGKNNYYIARDIGKSLAEKGYKVGKIDPDLGQESFFFRSYRTYWNSLENIIPILGMITVAILAGYSPFKLGIITWILSLIHI